MARNKRDVDLVIRARNEASKALDSIRTALERITDASEEFQRGGRGTDTLLGQIGEEVGRLQKAVRGANPFDRLADGSKRAEQVVQGLQSQLQRTAQENVRLAAELRETEAAEKRLAAQAEQAAVALAEQTKATQTAKDEQRELAQAVRKTETEQRRRVAADQRTATSLTTLADRAQKAQERFDTLSREIAETENPTKRMVSAHEAARRSLERELAAIEQAQQAHATNREELVRTGQRLTELRSRLGAATQAFEQNSAAQTKQKNTLAETRAQAQGAQQTLGSLRRTLDENARAFNQQGTALQKALEELQSVRAATTEADAAVAKLGGTVRLQLLRALSEAQQRMQDFRNAQQYGTSVIAGMAAGGDRSSPEFQEAVKQARIAKQAYREQQQAVARMRQELRAAGTDVNALAAAEQLFTAIMAATNQRVRDARAALEQYLKSTHGAAQAQDQASDSGTRFANIMSLIRKNTRQTLSFTQRLRGEVLALATAYVGLQGALRGSRGVVDAYMTLEAVQNRLGAVFEQDTQRVAQEIDWLFAQADRLGIAFDTLSDAYAKFAVAAKAANFESEATRAVFLSVAEAGRVNKLSVEQLNGIFLALEQMISKGKVQSEELRRQLGDRLPGAFTIMADALGMTTAELDRAMSAGEVWASQDTLLKFADELGRRFGAQLPESLRSFTAQLGRFQNELYKAQLRVGEAGFISGLRDVLASLTTFFQSAEGQQFFNNLGAAAGGFLRILALIPENFDVIVSLVGALIGFKLGAYLRAIAADFTTLGARTRVSRVELAAYQAASTATAAQTRGLTGVLAVLRGALVATAASARASGAALLMTVRGLTAARVAAVAVTGAMRILRAVLATLGGPIGLIATGLSILFVNWVSSASDALEVTTELSRQLRELRKAYEGAADGADDWRSKLEGLTATQAEGNVKRLAGEVRNGVSEINKIIGREIVEGSGLSISRLWRETFSPQELAPLGAAVKRLNDDIQAGLVPNMAEFRKELDRAAQANPRLKDLVFSILDIVDSSKRGEASLSDLTDAYQQQRDVLSALTGSTDEQTAALRRLGVIAEETADAQKSVAERLDAAFQALNEKLPETEAEMKRLAEVQSLTDIIKEFEDANKDAWSSTDLERYLALLDRVRAGIQAVNDAAVDKAVNRTTVDRIINVESGGDPNARNPMSSATGLGQFIESTWLDMFRRYFPDRAESMSREAILALRENADVSRQMVELYARENARVLQQAGVAVNDAALYLAHFLGPQGALRVLQAAPDTPLEELLGAGQITANKQVLEGRNARELVEWARQRVGLTTQEIEAQKTLQKIEDDRAKQQKDFAESVADANEQRRFDLAQAKLEEAGLGRQAAINAALRSAEQAALKANVTLTKEQREEIERTAGALYNQQNAQKLAAEERRKVEERVNNLLQTRQALMESIKFAESQNDGPAAEALRTQLTSVNEQLRAAVEAARAFWTAMGGPEAELALANLRNVENSIQEIGHSFLLTADQINQSAAQMGADAFMDFVDAIAEGENVLDSLGAAFKQLAADFLRMIARMIMQQAIFNALQAAGFGGGVSGAVGSIFHSGGVVSTSGVGRMVSPGWFAGAARYHTGGIAGLRPNEVPAILERGEEVLTRDDPRHRANGAGGVGGEAMQPVIINTFDAGSFMSEGLNTAPGQKAFFNFVRANSGQIRRLLGSSNG